MPNSASAEKRLRQTEKRRLLNKDRKTELKTLAKKFDRAIHDGKKDDAESLSREYVKRLDQAASQNVVHKNYVSRHKATIATKVAKLA